MASGLIESDQTVDSREATTKSCIMFSGSWDTQQDQISMLDMVLIPLIDLYGYQNDAHESIQDTMTVPRQHFSS